MKGYTADRFELSLFQNPPSWYRGVPFWSWNCRVDERKIKRDVSIFKEMGFGGADIHSRYGLQNEYLSGEFMQLVKKADEELTSRGLLTWLYDEDRWPSGGAGGLIARPENASRCLLFTPEKKTEGFCDCAEAFYKKQNAGEDPEGFFLGKYEVLLHNGELSRYRRCDQEEEILFGGEMWYAYLALERNDIWYNGFGYVDTLNPRVIREFLAVTYERYNEACGEHFNESIPVIFTDEPQFAYKETLALPEEKKEIHLSYTDDLSEAYGQKYGSPLLNYVPELIWELPDGKASVHRYRYHDFVAERFSESYFRQIYDWCERNHIMLTGHAVEESTLWSQTRAIGEAMRCYQNLHIPGIDILCDAREYTTAKQAQSVARQDGRDGVMSELYGVTNWDYTFREHKIQGDWQMAMGVSHRVLSLSLMSMEGASKRDFPASLNYHVPWYREYRQIEEYFARVNTAMLAGKGVVRIGVIHPIESYWLHWGPVLQTTTVREEMEARFSQLVEWLVFGLLDFDFISESLLPNKYVGNAEGFRVGEMNYDVILIPACETLRSTTLNCLKEFKRKGGKIIFLEKAGMYVDAVPCQDIKRFAKECEIIPFSKAAILQVLESVREVDVIVRTSGQRSKDMLYQLRQEEGRCFLFLCNVTQQEKPNFFEISGEGFPCQLCDIILQGIYQVTKLNPFTGEEEEADVTYQKGKTIIGEGIYAAQSMLYLLDKTDKMKPTPEINRLFKIDEPVIMDELTTWGYTLEEPNVMLLDMSEFAVNGGGMRSREEILRIQRRINEELQYQKDYTQPWADNRPDERKDILSLRFMIHSEIEGIKVLLGAEHPEYCKISWNGTAVIPEAAGWYVDESIKTIALGEVQKGENELFIIMRIGPKTYIEPFYLLGDFGVRIMGKEAVITALPEKLYFGGIREQGLPFYSGNLIYHCEYQTEEEEFGISCHDFYAPLLGISIDGKRIGSIMTSPYQLQTGCLEKGNHKIDITVFGNRYNTFGPLHNSNENYDWYGECAWETKGINFSYEYHFKPFGIYTAPRILKGSKTTAACKDMV